MCCPSVVKAIESPSLASFVIPCGFVRTFSSPEVLDALPFDGSAARRRRAGACNPNG